MWSALTDWLVAHQTLLTWLGAASALMFFASLAVVPVLLTRMPADYFHPRHDDRRPLQTVPPPLRWPLLMVKNLVGTLCVATGVAMLVLPGQGILSILIGLSLMDFPNKRELERRLVKMPAVLKSVDWLRRRAGRPGLDLG